MNKFWKWMELNSYGFYSKISKGVMFYIYDGRMAVKFNKQQMLGYMIQFLHEKDDMYETYKFQIGCFKSIDSLYKFLEKKIKEMR